MIVLQLQRNMCEEIHKHKYIITSDMDYLQLLNERTHIYNLKYKQLVESKNAFESAEKNLFYKIVTGDKDNIPGIFKNGIKTAEKLFNVKMNL